MDKTCWTVSEYIFAQVSSSALWFVTTAIGWLVFYKFRHKVSGVLKEIITKAVPSTPTADQIHICSKCGHVDTDGKEPEIILPPH